MPSVSTEKFVPSVWSLYRNCLRLLDRAAVDNPGLNPARVRPLVRMQFEANKDVKDPQKIDELKHRALGALSNYIIHLSPELKKAQNVQEVKHV
mmetsp:Transcript_70620/g.166514  ORF Transcript_70620/g.166514 Transcript_70620/m.166514 type:complete len:94 (-) Transcript_70620:39-320(-)